jgi:hypothetical protein
MEHVSQAHGRDAVGCEGERGIALPAASELEPEAASRCISLIGPP